MNGIVRKGHVGISCDLSLRFELAASAHDTSRKASKIKPHKTQPFTTCPLGMVFFCVTWFLRQFVYFGAH